MFVIIVRFIIDIKVSSYNVINHLKGSFIYYCFYSTVYEFVGIVREPLHSTQALYIVMNQSISTLHDSDYDKAIYYTLHSTCIIVIFLQSIIDMA